METDGRIGVLHVISGLSLGGAERMLLWSAKYHDRDLLRMGVVSLMTGGEIAREIRKEGVEVHELGQQRGRMSVSSFFTFWRIIRAFNPRILQGHMYHSNILVRFAGSFRRKTAVLSTRHIDYSPQLRRFLNSVTGFLNGSTLVFSQRVLDMERRENLFRRPIKLIQYGIDVDSTASEPGVRADIREEMGLPEDAFVWIAVGRLTRQKGFHDLITAFSGLIKRKANTVLVIAGVGEEKSDLQRLAADRGVGDSVIFAGERKDIPGLLAACDAFVLSSLWEGGPLVILEAMAAGLPVVSTRAGDAPSMIREGETGTLVDSGNTGQLLNAMDRVQSMGPAAQEWGRKGRMRVVELYDFTRVQRDTEEYYRELAGEEGQVH